MEFVFKRALVRSEETWKLEGTQLIGPDGAVELKDVTACNFNYTILKGGLTASELKLTTNEKATTLDCVGQVRTEHRDTFLRLALETFGVLRAQNPNIQVTSTGTDIMAWGFATIGTASALWGIYFAGSNDFNEFAWHLPRARFITNQKGGVGAVMLLLGAFMIWVGAPWKSNKPKSLTEAIEWLERLRAL